MDGRTVYLLFLCWFSPWCLHQYSAYICSSGSRKLKSHDQTCLIPVCYAARKLPHSKPSSLIYARREATVPKCLSLRCLHAPALSGWIRKWCWEGSKHPRNTLANGFWWKIGFTHTRMMKHSSVRVKQKKSAHSKRLGLNRIISWRTNISEREKPWMNTDEH